MGAEADLRGMIGMVLPEVREAVGHLEGLAQLCQTTSIAKEVPSLMSCNLRTRALVKTANSVNVSLEC